MKAHHQLEIFAYHYLQLWWMNWQPSTKEEMQEQQQNDDDENDNDRINFARTYS